MKNFKKGMSLLLAALVVLSCWVWVDPAPVIAEAANAQVKDKFLFAYFTGTSKEGQTIHLAVSEDGYNYTALRNNEPVIIPSKGVGNVRDPYIWYNEQDNYYYILATDLDFTDGGGDYSNNSQSFIIWRSKDLVNWYDETFIDVSKMAHLIGDTRNMSAVWAPQVLWDGSAYVVYFTLACNATSWFDIVYLKTTDLMDPNAYYEFDYILGNSTGNGVDNGYGVIDADIIHNPGDGKYYLFYKTECNGHEMGSTATGTSLKTIHYYVGDTPTGPFRNPGDTKWSNAGFSVFPNYNVSLEGCNSFFDNNGNLIMYADEFEHKNAAGEPEAYFHIAKSDGYNFKSWSYPNVNSHNINSLSPRHGSVVKITTEEYNRLLENSYNINSSSYPDTEVLKDHLVAQYFTTNDVKWNNVIGQPNLASSTGITMIEDPSRGWYAKFDETSGGWAEVDFDSLFRKSGGLNYEDGFTITFSARCFPIEGTTNSENNDRIYEIADVFGSRTETEHYTHFSPGGGGNGSYLGNYNGPVDSGNDWLNDINRANRDDGCFHEYIISYATGNVMVYVDGQLVISRNRFTGVKLDDSWYEALGSNATMRIGRSGWEGDPLFKGNIQNLCIYDCSMSYYDAQSMNDDYKENHGWVNKANYTGIATKVPTFQNSNADRMNSLPNKNQHFSNILYTSETVKNYDGNNMSADSAAYVKLYDPSSGNQSDVYAAVFYPETTVLLYDGVNDAIMPISFGAYCENKRDGKGFYNVYPTTGPKSNTDNNDVEITQDWRGWWNNGDYYRCITEPEDGYIGRNSATRQWSQIKNEANYDAYWGAPLKVKNTIDFGGSYYKKLNLTWQIYGNYKNSGSEANTHQANITSDNDIYVINFKPILDLRNTITEAMYNEVMNNSALCPELREKYAAAVYAIRTMDPTNYGFDESPITATKACAKAISEAVGTYNGVMAEIAREKNEGTYGHQCTELPARQATCSKNGLTAGSYCVLCGEIIEKQQTLATTGHTFGAEFTEDGVKYKQCSVCGVKIEYQASGVRYANLFSLNRWIDSTSNNVHNGTISTNSANGTITIVNQHNTEMYTRAHYDGQNLVSTRDFGNDCIPVTGGKTYVVEATSLASSTSGGEVFVFQYTKDGLVYAAIPTVLGLAPGQTAHNEFTVDKNAAYIELRFDCNDAGKTITYSQIGVYEKERFIRFGATTADARLGFYPGESKELCYPNPAPGYTFNGWYTVDGRLIENVYQLNNPTTIVYGNWTEAGLDVTYDSIFSFSDWAKSSCNQLYYKDDNSTGTLQRLVKREGLLTDPENGTITIYNDADTNNFARTNYWVDNGNVHKMPLEPNTEYILEYTATSDDGAKPSVCLYITGGTAQYPETGNATRYSTGTHYFRFDSGDNTTLTLRFDNVQHGTTVTFSDIAVYKAEFEEAARNITNREYRRYYPTQMGIGDVFEYTPTRPGYTFGTWMAETNFADDKLGDFDMKGFDDTFVVENNWQLYSTWTENSYTIKYNANGGSGSIANQTVKYTETVTLPSTGVTKTGFTLAGWSTNPDATTATYQVGQSVTRLTGEANGTVTLYAIWKSNEKVNITFDNLIDFKAWNKSAGNGTVSEVTDTGFTITANDGVSESTSGSPYFEVKPGKQYRVEIDITDIGGKGWDVYIFFCDANGSWVNFADGPTNRYSNNTSHTIKEENGKTYSAVFTAPDVDSVVKAQIRVDANNANGKVNFNNIRVYEYNGVNIDVSPVNKYVITGDPYGTLPTPTKVGYTFAGWKNGDTAVNANTVLSSESTVYLSSTWNPNKYTVKFNSNGGTGTVADMSMTYDASANLTANSFTRTGYTFDGWDTKADGSGKPYADKESVKNLTDTANGTVTLYAQWKANTYTITFAGNGATSGSTADMSMVYDTAKALNANGFSKTGYTFAGWKAPDGTIYADKQSVTNLATSGTVTLTAQWTANSYDVVFNANDGSGKTTTQAITYDVTTALAANGFTREGYTFKGWSTSANGSKVYDDKAQVLNLATSGSFDLYAVWEANTYTITFAGNGATSGSTADMSMVYDTAKALNANGFSKTGYSFAGWKAPNGTIYADKQSVTNLATSGTVTLTAQWTANTYTIKLNANGGSGSTMADMSMTYDKAAALTANTYTMVDYAFMGWSTSVDGEVVYADGQSVINLAEENGAVINLYAVWDQPIVNVTFDNLVDISAWSQTAENGTLANATETGFTVKSASTAGEATCISDYFLVEAGHTYVIQSDIKGDNWDVYILFNTATSTGAGINFSEATSRFSSDDGGVAEANNGITYTAEFTAPAGAERAQIRVEANGSNNAVRFENIRVYDAANTTYLETVNKYVQYSYTYGKLPVPVKEGCVFTGWVDENRNAVTADTIMKSVSTVNLTSTWSVDYNSVNDDTVVIDYGLPVKIDVLSNDNTTAETSVNSIGESVGTTDLGNTGYQNSVFESSKTELDLASGSATLSENIITYVPTSTDFKAEEILYYEVIVDGRYYYAKITIIPATSVYYEDSDGLIQFNDKTVTKSGVTYEYKWQNLGTSVGEVFQSADRPAFNFADDAQNVYGYDSAYDSNVTYSGGTAHYVEVDKPSIGNEPTAEFTFTGTGFDLFSVTDNVSGAIRIDIYKKTAGGESIFRRKIVNNYYGYDYDSANDKYVPVKPGDDGENYRALFQVPVISNHGFDYGTYRVVIIPYYSSAFDIDGDGKFGVYVDSVRIFDPMGTDNATANDAYMADGEYAPQYRELRSTLVTPITNSNGEFTGEYDVSALGENKSVFLDGGKTSADDFGKIGPNNEVYLANGQSIAFDIVTDSAILPSTIQIGMKLTGYNGSAYNNTSYTGGSYTLNPATVNLMNSGYNSWVENITLNSATERFYNMEAVVDWELQSDGTYKTAAPIVITNTSDSVISLTSLKWAFDQELATTVLTLLSDEQTPVLAMAALRRIADGGEQNNPQATILSKDNISTAFSGEPYTVGDNGILTITTEQGVAGVTVNGEDVLSCETDENGKLKWTYEFTADIAGYVTYDVVARDENGVTSETVYAVTYVEAEEAEGEGSGDVEEPTTPEEDEDGSGNISDSITSLFPSDDSFASTLISLLFQFFEKILGMLSGGAIA